MDYQGVIRNFINYTPAQVETMRADLGLSMPVESLRFCVHHYRNFEKRDPYIDEMRMLERLNCSMEKGIHAISPTDLLTNDDFVAETYADLLQKRKAIDPTAQHPCTLLEAAKIASVYLIRAGKAPTLRSASLYPECVEETQYASPRNSVTTSDAPYRLRVLPFSTSRAEKGDLLLLLSPKSGETRISFQKSYEALLEDEQIQTVLKGIYTVRKQGLLCELLEIANSLWIDLRAFSPIDTPMPMTVLTDNYSGDLILRISADALTSVQKILTLMNLNGITFASVTDNGRFTFSRSLQNSFSIHTQFLRSLFHYKGGTAKLGNETPGAALSVQHEALAGSFCAYLAQNAYVPRETALVNGVLSATAFTAPKDHFYRHALYTVLTPILSMCVCGVDFSTQSLSVGLEIPEKLDTPQCIGNCFSTLLGLYRAQTELAVPAHAVAIRQSAIAHSPSATVFSLAETAESKPLHFTKAGAYVFCAAPRILSNGLPDFEDLRRMLTCLTQHAKEGHISSFTVLCGQSVTDGLRKMCGNYTCKLSDPKIAVQGALPLAILFESPILLPFHPIGVTQKNETRATFLSPALPINRPSLVWSEKPEVVLLAKASDANAHALAYLLRKRGCEVHIFDDSERNAFPLSRAILGSQFLISCKGIFLPDSAQISFAMETFRRACGIAISLKQSNAKEKDYFHLPNGITDEILQKICRDENKNLKKS